MNANLSTYIVLVYSSAFIVVLVPSGLQSRIIDKKKCVNVNVYIVYTLLGMSKGHEYLYSHSTLYLSTFTVSY